MALTFGGGSSPFDVANPYQAPPGIGNLAGAFAGQPAGGLPSGFPGMTDYQRSQADPFWKYKQVISGQDRLPIMVNLPGPGGAPTPLQGGPSAGGRTVGPFDPAAGAYEKFLKAFGPMDTSHGKVGSGGGGGTGGGGGGGGGGLSSGSSSRSSGSQTSTRQMTPEMRAELEDYKRRYGLAEQGVENRYQQMLGIAGKTTGQREADIREAYKGKRANVAQRLARLGMANTTVLPTELRGQEREEQSALNRLADEMQRTQLGIIGGREPGYPKSDILSILAGLAPTTATSNQQNRTAPYFGGVF